MDEKVDTFLVNASINQPIVEYVYIPKFSALTPQKRHYLPHGRLLDSLETELDRKIS